MKSLFLAASAISLMIASPVLAATPQASTDVEVEGTVGAQCGVGNQSGGGERVANSETVDLGSIVNANGFLSVPVRDIHFDNVWCNAPNAVTMTVTKLSTGTAVLDTSSFVNRLDMVLGSHADATVLPWYFGGATTVRTAAGGGDGVLTYSNGAAFETGTGRGATASLSVVLPAGTVGNDRPIAGDYSGTITFTATPST